MLTTRRTQHLHRVIASSFPSAHGSAFMSALRPAQSTVLHKLVLSCHAAKPMPRICSRSLHATAAQ